MAEIKNIGGQSLPIGEQNVQKIGDDAGKLPTQLPQNQGDSSVGRGNVGQPVGLPPTDPTTQNALMPNVVTGRDASQLAAAEKMRANGGHSATDVLLGLDRQPSTLGVMLPPPGNLEALRHLSPAMRRTILRNLLAKQRGQMRQLVAVMRDDEQHQQHSNNDENQETDAEILSETSNKSTNLLMPSEFHNQRALRDLEATTKMLDLLDELLGMQDYTLSQMGTFAQG
jgi:hypothetical protein